MNLKIKSALLSLLVTAALPVLANPIVNWTFETKVQTAAIVDPNVTASDFTLSSGTVAYSSGNAPTGPTAISGTGWNVSDGDKGWGFTVIADAGYVLNLASLTFDDRASGTGAADWSVTVNGIAAVSSQSTHGSFSTTPMNTVDLTAFQNLTSAEIKIFGFGASGSTGTWRLDNVTLNGTAMASVPDSMPLGFDAGVLAGLLALARRFADDNRTVAATPSRRE